MHAHVALESVLPVDAEPNILLGWMRGERFCDDPVVLCRQAQKACDIRPSCTKAGNLRRVLGPLRFRRLVTQTQSIGYFNPKSCP